MQRRLRPLVAAIACLVLLSGCAEKPQTKRNEEVEVVVSAAASLTDALQEAQRAFTMQHDGIILRFNFGSSGALAQQIAQGAPVDLFISAARAPMDTLVDRRFVAADSVRTLATNRLVLVRGTGAGERVRGWESLTGAERIALGNPEHVPAGQYGRRLLEKLDLWSAVEPRLVLAEDVRQVLRFVESGEVDAGIIYQTDAASSQKVIVIAEAPEGALPPVVYPMAVLQEAAHRPEAERFATFLLSPDGRQILSRYGFGSE